MSPLKSDHSDIIGIYLLLDSLNYILCSSHLNHCNSFFPQGVRVKGPADLLLGPV